MHKLLIRTLLTIVPAGVTYILVYNHFTGHFPWAESYPEREIHIKVPSKVLSEEREIIVYLPRDYDASKKYPVMYVLDGGSQHRAMVNVFDVLSSAGHASSTLVVGIPNLSDETRQRDYTPPYLRMDTDVVDSPAGNGDRFLDFIESELIPFIGKNYPVSEERLFCGNSRGGLLVMHSLLYKPGLFRGRFCFSSPYWRENEIMVSKVSAFLDLQDTLDTFVYMSAGELETERMKQGFESMKALFQKKSPCGITWRSVYTRNADHQSNSIYSAADAAGAWSQYIRSKRNFAP